MRDISQKLRRMLYLVPYVAKHPDGVDVDELAAQMSIDRDQLLADFDLLSQVGPPDGDPGEYLLVTVEEGRVFIDLPQRLTRPLRLTPAEGCSLLLGIRTLRESGIAPFDNALQSAEAKLLRAMGRDAEAARALATDTVVAEPDSSVSRHLVPLVRAAREHRAIAIQYGSVSGSGVSARDVDPFGVVQHAGNWYLVGHCHKRGDTRTFRIDRISSFEPLERRFEVPADFDLETYRRERLYVPPADSSRVKVYLDAIATARIGNDWPLGNVSFHNDGSATITMECEGFAWVTDWTLGFGHHAKVLEPPAAIAAMTEHLAALAKQVAA